MKPSPSIRTVMLFLFLGLVSNVSTYASQGRGQSKGKSEKQDKGKPDKSEGNEQGSKTGPPVKQLPPGQAMKQERLSQIRQQQLIREQRQRVVVYRQRLDRQQILAQQYSVQLKNERRAASYAYHQAYIARLREQQLVLQRSYDYNTDPYFYTAPTYRYSRAGTYHEINQYEAETLRQAINAGYSEGLRSGQADRQDGWTLGYRSSYPYQDANYGYDGRYGDQDDYNYYFREGFSRGYEDGYNRRSQYGSDTNGSQSLLGTILTTILNLQALR